ncbi:MAG: NAD(P)H-dependent flavin oxidoreductase [Promethearchaeia archaeon]
MIKTELIERIEGLKYPIIQGGMGPFLTTELAIAVANAGGLGIISGTGLMTGLGVMDDYGQKKSGSSKKLMKEAVIYVAKQTHDDAVYGINVPVAAEARALIGGLFRGFEEARKENQKAREKCKVIITSAGKPDVIPKLKRKNPGIVNIHVVPRVRHALSAVKAGADIIVASGHEGGAHINPRPVHTSVLLPSVIEAIPDVPVVAAGGFGDGKGLAWALLMGACGIQMGTRFIATQESDFHQKVKETIVKAQAHETIVTQGLIGHMRYYYNDTAKRLKSIVDRLRVETGAEEMVEGSSEIADFELKHFNNMAEGKVEDGLLPMGEIAGRINDIPTCKELIERIMNEAEKILSNYPNIISIIK